MAILDIIKRACILCGVPSPSGAVSATDLNTQQMVEFAQDEGESIAKLDWRELKIAWTITGDGTTTLWPLPADFERLLPGEAFFSNMYPSIPLIGPMSDEEFLAAKALPVMPIRPIWRLIGKNVEIWPALANGEVINSQYRTKNWIVGTDGVGKELFTLDTDLVRFPERVLRLAVVWRWKRSKGLDYAEEFRAYELAKDIDGGHDSGNRVIHMSTRNRMPDTYWPGVISVQS